MRKAISCLAFCVMVVFLLATVAPAQQAPSEQGRGQAAGVILPPPDHSSLQQSEPGGAAHEKQKCPQWQSQHEQITAELKAMDARLAEKVAAMNAVSDNGKIEAMAVVINELVA